MTQRGFPPELLTQAPATRLAYFKACTIAHPRLQEADQALQEAISEPTGALLVFFYSPTGRARPPCSSGAGSKSSKSGARRWSGIRAGCRSSGWRRSPRSAATSTGGIVLLMPYGPSTSHFIHRKISNPEPTPCAGARRNTSPGGLTAVRVLRVALESAIRQRRPLAFLVDEARRLAKMAGGRKLQDQLDCVKSLAIRTQTVHVLAGTYDLLILRQLSGQLSRRTRHIHFARYRADTAESVRDFPERPVEFPNPPAPRRRA